MEPVQPTQRLAVTVHLVVTGVAEGLVVGGRAEQTVLLAVLSSHGAVRVVLLVVPVPLQGAADATAVAVGVGVGGLSAGDVPVDVAGDGLLGWVVSRGAVLSVLLGVGDSSGVEALPESGTKSGGQSGIDQ